MRNRYTLCCKSVLCHLLIKAICIANIEVFKRKQCSMTCRGRDNTFEQHVYLRLLFLIKDMILSKFISNT